MIFNIFTSFLLPWFIVIFVLKIDHKIILLIAPFASIIAHILNTWTIAYDFVEVYPYPLETNFASIPMITGIIPALSTVLIYLIKAFGLSMVWITAFSFGSSFLEWILVFVGLAKYYNGWNVVWTFGIYIIGYSSVYGYYKILTKLKTI